MYSERIRKMRDDGLLSDAQAKALEESLSPLASADLRPPRSTFTSKLVLLTCVVLVLLSFSALFIYVPEGGTPTAEIQDVRETLNVPGGTGSMTKPLSTLASAALLLLPLTLIIAAFAWFYNGIVEKEERVFEAWSQVESNLQRRADLVPNLVEAVSRYMKHERETLADVTEQRADALNPLADAMDRLIRDQQVATQEKGASLDDENALARLAQAQQTLAGSLKNLIAVAESYPNLRSGDQFLALQAQLEGTENRINVARMEFNRAVGEYNSAIRRLPGTLIASLGNFRRKAYFQAEGDAAKAVEVNFDEE